MNKMNNNSFLRIDLLKKRRKGVELENILFSSNKNILIKGIAIGSSFLIISILICIVTFVQSQLYKKEILRLKESTSYHDELKSQINKGLSEISLTERFNINLAKSILGLRSIPEIVYEIGSLVPIDSKLESIKINKNFLNLNGNSKNELNLDLINTFILGLKSSPFIKKETVTLVNAKDLEIDSKDEDIFKKNLKFNITAEFISDYSEFNKMRINKIKSQGLAQRIQLIKNEDLIK